MKNSKSRKSSHSASLASGGGALSLASRALRACDVVKLFSQEVERIFEGKTLSRIAKIRSRSLSNFPFVKQYSIVLLGRVLSQGERKFVNPLSWERGRGEGNSSFAQQTETDLPSYHPNVLSTSNKLDCHARRADGGNRARNDVTTLVPQYLSALVPSKKVAFTLAEVLITLGIIGVVAAITMPTLIANYQKKVFSALLKQDVSWVQNSIKRILADEGIENIYESSVGRLAFDAGNRQTVPAVDGTKFGEYFKLDKYEYYYPSVDEFDNMSDEELYDFENKMYSTFMLYIHYGQPYRLKNGGCFVVYTEAYGYPGSFPDGYTYFIVDVNCDKKPNIVGKDRFAIGLEKNGALVRELLTKEDLELYSNTCTELQKSFAEGENIYLSAYGYALWPCSVPVIIDGFNIK